ncbi:hypothetical protein V6N13_105927 [Hibiscus sabdariffa]|uniref:Dirigent protein n=1 Tax=Hibiscus sabdariffa TaxID=183260 RepID=A0ABR2EZ68_9ROSI
MEKHIIFALAMILFLSIAPAHGQYYSGTVTPRPRPEKMTRLHFFFHDIISGKNPTAVLIARPDNSSSPFGRLYAIDDPLTVGPELTSMVIGNAQGLYLSLSRDPSLFTAVLYVDFAFTSGRFNGSSFSLFSRYAAVEYDGAAEPEREMAIVGGRGAFRMARGFAQTRGISTNATTGDAITEFNVTLYHY